jgi:hypothetical protein
MTVLLFRLSGLKTKKLIKYSWSQKAELYQSCMCRSVYFYQVINIHACFKDLPFRMAVSLSVWQYFFLPSISILNNCSALVNPEQALCSLLT